MTHSPKQISDHIAKDHPVNAINFVNALLDRCETITDAPEGYKTRPELGENIRSVSFKRYMIFYTAEGANVRIERILQGSRDYLGGEFL